LLWHVFLNAIRNIKKKNEQKERINIKTANVLKSYKKYIAYFGYIFLWHKYFKWLRR